MANILLVYPRNPVTFWSFDQALKIAGRQSAFPPLGLLTIAGMLPETYDLRLVDMNVRSLRDEELRWADAVVTSSMIIHWDSLQLVIARCNQAGVPVLNGGPLPTQYADELEGDAIFYLGEAENGFLDLVERMIAQPREVGREIVDRRGAFQSLAKTPLPRWDLINFNDYQNLVIQMTRGCPESCTFCNIPTLYGRTTRIKAKSRMTEELDALYSAGWRGAVMVVDDNFVGNREAIREALEEEVIPWQKERGYPFSFFTQASIRLSDDPALLEAMYRAGFDEIFAGIESPAEESLKFMGARKNLQGSAPLLQKVRTLQGYGFEVQAGFIVGLDTDPEDIAERMIAFIREAGIPIAMVGILGVLRDTPDYKRFKRAGRLVEGIRYSGDSGVFSRQLSFVPKVEPEVLFDRHRRIVETLNSPEIFFERCLTLLDHKRRQPIARPPLRLSEVKAFLRSLWHQGAAGNYRKHYWRFLGRVVMRNPRAFSDAIRLAVQGHHLILTTQQALQVEEMRTFFPEALDQLRRFCEGCRQDFERNLGSYATRMMVAAQARFENHQDDWRTLQHNAEVLLHAASTQHAALREEFRYQVKEALERFERDIEELLESYAGAHFSTESSS